MYLGFISQSSFYHTNSALGDQTQNLDQLGLSI